MSTLEFYYDYASPFSYLADSQLSALAERTGTDIVYRPVLLGAVVVESKNTPPPAVPAKMRYIGQDIPRWVRRYGIPFTMNPNFPLSSVRSQRAALVALEDGGFERYHRAMFQATYVEGANIADVDIVIEIASKAGLDGRKLRERIEDPAVKERLKADTTAAVERGLFGLPTFFVGDEMFFGNDRLDFVEEELDRS